MNKKAWIVMLLIALIAGVAVASAVQKNFWTYPQTITIIPTLAVYLEGTEWANGTQIDWGSQEANATYQYNLDVQNLSNATIRVTMQITGLEADWMETWSVNNTLLEFEEWANGTLTLSIPYGVPEDTYSWNSYIKGEYT